MRAQAAILALTAIVGCSRRAETVAPPVITLVNASPIAVPVGGAIRLTCSATSASTGVVSYRWSVSSSGAPPEALEGIAVDYKATRPGAFVATCTASNASGSDIKTVPFTVDADGAPPTRAPGAVPKSPIAIKVKCDKPRVHGGDDVVCDAEVAGTADKPEIRWKTSLGAIEATGERATLRTPRDARRGGQVTARIDVEVTTPTGAGAASISVLVDVVPCEKVSLDTAPSVAFKRPAAETDAGAPDAGAARSPAEGLAACRAQLAACFAETRKEDACVKSVTRCQTPRPWQGDPGGFDCCPTACVEAYFKRRTEQCADEAFEAFAKDACYEGGAAPRP